MREDPSMRISRTEVDQLREQLADDRLRVKYFIHDAKTGEPVDGCFVLRPDRDPAALVALLAYADATDKRTLACDLRAWVDELSEDHDD